MVSIDIDYSVLLQMANFLVLLVVLNLVLYRPIRAILKKRRERLEGLANEAAACVQQQEETNRELADGRKQAQAEGGAFRNELKNEALATEKEQLAKVQEKVDAESALTEKQVKEQLAKAREELLGKVDSFSLVAAQKILGRSF